MSKSCVIKRCSAELYSSNLCNRHNKQAQAHARKYGCGMNQAVTNIVKIENANGDTMPTTDEELTMANAGDMYEFYRAKKTKEDASKREMDRMVQQGLLCFKAERDKEIIEVLKPAIDRILSLMNDLPKSLAMKSESQVREILSDETKLFMKGALNFLEGFEQFEGQDLIEEKEEWLKLESAE